MQIKQKKVNLFFFISVIFSAVCVKIRFYYEVLTCKIDGKKLMENETSVKSSLEKILLNPEAYLMNAYTRKAFSPKLKRTPTYYHSFYTITNETTHYCGTLSFTGASKKIYSRGVWVMNTEKDTASYNSYKYGNNEWDVQLIPTDKGINTKETVINVLYRINKGITYYYKAHLRNRADMENCNLALLNTLVKKN